MTHALLSPSSAARWTECIASVILSKDLPDETSEFAAEGTLAHATAEALLNSQPIPVEATEEMVDYVMTYVRKVEEVMNSGDCTFFQVEMPIDVSKITLEPEAHGTADAVLVVDNNLHVFDLKYGRGVSVSAKQNVQLGIYAAGLLLSKRFPKVHTVTLHIVQPRLSNDSEWSVPAQMILDLAGLVTERAKHIWDILNSENNKLANSDFFCQEDVCRFCKAKASCPAMRKMLQNSVLSDFEVAHPDRPLFIPGTDRVQLGRYFAVLPVIRQWCDAVESATRQQLMAGQVVPGAKLVKGRQGNRRWADAAQVEDYFANTIRLKDGEMYEKKMITPTQAEKLMKKGRIGKTQWGRVESMITRPEGQPLLVPETDARPALEIDNNDFEVITNG